MFHQGCGPCFSLWMNSPAERLQVAESLGALLLGFCRSVPAKAPLGLPERRGVCGEFSETMCPAVLDGLQDTQG